MQIQKALVETISVLVKDFAYEGKRAGATVTIVVVVRAAHKVHAWSCFCGFEATFSHAAIGDTNILCQCFFANMSCKLLLGLMHYTEAGLDS
jgi:nitrite reductase/ring-hydroxylating ferredoxin subunit